MSKILIKILSWWLYIKDEAYNYACKRYRIG